MIVTTVNRFLDDTPLLLESCAELILHVGLSDRMGEHPADARLREMVNPKMSFDEKSGIATIPVQGVLAYKPDAMEMAFFGMEDTSKLIDLVESASANEKVKGILLDVNSPGGFSTGVFSLADAVATAGKIKPVMAHIGGTSASAAYLIASQANEVIASRDSRVGSIGAYNVNIDRSRMIENAGIKVEVFKNKEAKYKAIGQIGTSLTQEHRDYLNANAQASFNEFRDTVRAKRPNISDDAMQGQVFNGKEALKKGLVDSNGSMLTAVAKLRSKIR